MSEAFSDKRMRGRAEGHNILVTDIFDRHKSHRMVIYHPHTVCGSQSEPLVQETCRSNRSEEAHNCFSTSSDSKRHNIPRARKPALIRLISRQVKPDVDCRYLNLLKRGIFPLTRRQTQTSAPN